MGQVPAHHRNVLKCVSISNRQCTSHFPLAAYMICLSRCIELSFIDYKVRRDHSEHLVWPVQLVWRPVSHALLGSRSTRSNVQITLLASNPWNVLRNACSRESVEWSLAAGFEDSQNWGANLPPWTYSLSVDFLTCASRQANQKMVISCGWILEHKPWILNLWTRSELCNSDPWIVLWKDNVLNWLSNIIANHWIFL